MAVVNPSSDIRGQTVSAAGVQAKLLGTPLEPYTEHFLYYAQQYGIDANWALAYLQWESGFGASEIGRANPTNPWDILCYPGQWGAVGEFRPGSGYCYAVYPSVETGIEAGFRQWRRYVDDGYTTYYATLCRSVSGGGPCNEQWVNNVIAQAQYNAAHWPNDGAPTPAPHPSAPPPGGGDAGGQPPAPQQPPAFDLGEYLKQRPWLVAAGAAALLVLLDY